MQLEEEKQSITIVYPTIISSIFYTYFGFHSSNENIGLKCQLVCCSLKWLKMLKFCVESQKAGKPESWKNLDGLGLKIRDPELHQQCVFFFCKKNVVCSLITTFNFKPTNKTSSVWNLYKLIM